MKQGFKDILNAVSCSPIWWDENGVPRFSPFHPSMLPDIYCDKAFFLKIACQSCGRTFDVGVGHAKYGAGLLLDVIFKREREETELHYGDPPNVDCCAAGATMSSDTLAVMEVWTRRKESGYGWRCEVFGPPESEETMFEKLSV